MPRNVVTLVPRLLRPRTKAGQETQTRVESFVVERFRARIERDPTRIKMDFPKRMSSRAAKDEVVSALDGLDRRWRRVFALYPSESALRDKGE